MPVALSRNGLVVRASCRLVAICRLSAGAVIAIAKARSIVALFDNCLTEDARY
jgi:hypothetical protein